MSALDIEARQVLVDFFGDPDGLHWHHRVLMVKGEPGIWTGFTPDLSVQVINLNGHRVIPLVRGCAIPHDLVAQTYSFDPLDEATLEDMRYRCEQLATVMGFPVSRTDVARGGVWVVSDLGVELFGSEIPEVVLTQPSECVTRGSVGVARTDGTWHSIQFVADGKMEEWKKQKHSGPGKDPRIACHIVVGGRRFVSEAMAREHWDPNPVKPHDHPLQGPLVAPEFFAQFAVIGLTLS